jgi:hypothetical protein
MSKIIGGGGISVADSGVGMLDWCLEPMTTVYHHVGYTLGLKQKVALMLLGVCIITLLYFISLD